MSKHTPGPLRQMVSELDNAILKSERRAINEKIAGYVQGHLSLLDAAPDLLAALEALLPLAANFNAATGVWNVQLDNARAALAKAKQ